MRLCRNRKFLAHLRTRRPYLDAEFRAHRRRYGVWKVAWRNHQATGTSDAVEESSGICCCSRSVPGGRQLSLSEIALPMPPGPGTACAKGHS